MTAGRLCARSVDVAAPGDSVQTAARRMSDRNVGTLVVVDTRQKPVGMLTDRDLTLRVLAQGRDPLETTVRDVMTADPETVTETTPIEDALRVMRNASCRRIPIVDLEGRLQGLLSLDDVLDRISSEFTSIGKLLRQETPQSMVERD